MPLKKTKKQKPDESMGDIYKDDIVFEESENDDKFKKVKEKLNICLKENKENLLGWQRARADFVNAKKENEERVKNSFAFAKSELMEDILPVVDSFDMAFANKEAWDKVDKGWRTGVEYIHTQLLSVLESNGLKQINPISQKFDPSLHTSVEVVDTSNKKEDEMILEVVQKGYEMNGKVVRAAKVKVGQYKK